MSRSCRGKLLLVCNDEFRSQSTTTSNHQPPLQQQLSERLGADVDVDNITALFKRLQFDVIYRNNLTASVSTCHCLIDCIVEFGPLLSKKLLTYCKDKSAVLSVKYRRVAYLPFIGRPGVQ